MPGGVRGWPERLWRIFNNVHDSAADSLRVKLGGTTPFEEIQAAEFTPLFELDSSNGLSLVRRDTVTTTGSGTVNNANAEHKLSTGTTSGSTAVLRTKERGRYQPGIQAIPGIAVR